MRKTKKKDIVFGVLILSHGRADQLALPSSYTLAEVRSAGYTGPIKIVVDDQDKELDKYKELFGDDVVVFSKEEASDRFDPMDNRGVMRSIVYARNVAFEVAKSFGWTHFAMFDDDYWGFKHLFTSEKRYCYCQVLSMDQVFMAMARFLESTPALTLAMLQGGDLLGGQHNRVMRSINLGLNGRRKAMNTFVCAVDRPFSFTGHMNEDVNTYVMLGAVGKLFFTTNALRMQQTQTQTSTGGATDMYKDMGTYVKSFYTIIGAPSCVKLKPMGEKHKRWHHNIKWRHAVPKILRESVRKGA